MQCLKWVIYAQGYKQQRAFIIAQSPMESTARDFWKMVYDRKCGVIVMLCDLVEDGKVLCVCVCVCEREREKLTVCVYVREKLTMCVCVCVLQEICYQYWPSSGSQTFGEFKVDLLGEEMMDGSVLKTFSVTHSEVCSNQPRIHCPSSPSLPPSLPPPPPLSLSRLAKSTS